MYRQHADVRVGTRGRRPAAGTIGVAPEWFYKGCGTHCAPTANRFCVPAYAEDGGEEPEIAGVYIVDDDGQSPPRRHGHRRTSSPTTFWRSRTTSTWRLRNCGPALSARNWWWTRISASCRERSSIERGGGTLVAGDRDRRGEDVATAWPTWSIIISSTRRTAGPAMSTSTSSARTPSASARASNWQTAT